MRTAHVITVEAEVADGRLDIGLQPKFGAPPVLNAISVLWTGP